MADTKATESSQPKESTKAHAPRRHAYDNPMLSAKEFLLAVMHDPTVPLHHRMDAAVKLLHITYIDGDYIRGEYLEASEPVLTYKIEGIKLQ
jgi:hypothetical protein